MNFGGLFPTSPKKSKSVPLKFEMDEHSTKFPWDHHSHFGNPYDEPSVFNGGNGLFTDVIIKCGDKEWKAHRGVLAARCPSFNICLSSPFAKEHERIIHMDDNDPTAVEAFLEFLYTGNLGGFYHFFQLDEFRNKIQPTNQIRRGVLMLPSPELVINICSVADKYSVGAIFKKLTTIFHCDPQFSPRPAQQCESLLRIITSIQTFASPEAAVLRKKLVHNLVTNEEVRNALTMRTFGRSDAHKNFAAELSLELIKVLNKNPSNRQGRAVGVFGGSNFGDGEDF